MIRQLATAVAYVKAPKATFLMKHPVKGTKAFVFARGLKSIAKTRSAMVIGAAAAAIPVAALVMKRRNGER